jgi:hypothetical protein
MAMENVALSEAARREGEILANIKKDLKYKRLVIIIGAGIIFSATTNISGPLPRITWTGLIRNDLNYLITERYVDASNRRTKQAYDAFKTTNVANLLNAANIIRGQLNLHNLFFIWLETVFKDFYKEVRHSNIFEILKALHKKNAALLTTNYNDLLKKTCDLLPIGRLNRNEILKFKYENLNGVFYMYKNYHNFKEIILNTINYYQITYSDKIQNILKTFLKYKIIVFINYRFMIGRSKL